MRENVFFKKNERITLEQYKNRTDTFWKNVKEKLLVDANEGEIYRVYNNYRDDVHGKYGLFVYSRLYRKISSINELIAFGNKGIYDELEDFEENESPNDLFYWSIEKYRLIDDEYERIYKIDLTSEYNLFGIAFTPEFLTEAKGKNYATAPEWELYVEWEFLCGWLSIGRNNIEYSYSRGDILKVDSRPYSSADIYFVYMDDGKVLKKDFYDRLVYEELFYDINLIGCYGFLPCHIEVVSSCTDELFDKLSFVVRNDSKKLEEILDQLRQKDDEEFFDYKNRVLDYEKEFLENK